MSYLILLSIRFLLQLQSSTSQDLAPVADIISSYMSKLAAEEEKLENQRIKLEKFMEMYARRNCCSSPCCPSSIVDSNASKTTALGSSSLAIANSITSGSDDRDSDSLESITTGGDQSSRVESESIYGYEQVLDLVSCANIIKSLVKKGSTTREILQNFTHLPDGERKLMQVVLKSLAVCNKSEHTWNIKAGKNASLQEVEDGIVAIWNATLKIPGTTYPQASDNCYSFMKIHHVPVERMDALFNRTVIDIYENKKATYSKYGLYDLKRRKPWEGMADFSKLTAV